MWAADIMHGNGVSVGKYKTRHLQDLVHELVRSFEIHQSCGSRLNGVHLEQTGEVDANGESVTEILGGSMELDAEELPKRYNTFCDARLNMTQSLGELASNSTRRLVIRPMLLFGGRRTGFGHHLSSRAPRLMTLLHSRQTLLSSSPTSSPPNDEASGPKTPSTGG